MLLRPQSAKFLINGSSQRSFKTMSNSNSRPISAVQSKTKRKSKDRILMDLNFPTPKDNNNPPTKRPQSSKTQLNVNSNDQIDYAEIRRMKPKYIKLDKERLYEDTIHLKNSLNASLSENTKLKTKILNLQVFLVFHLAWQFENAKDHCWCRVLSSR